MTAPIGVSAVGMACPIGLTAQAACAAMRAGIDRRQELPYRDKHGRPFIGSALARLFDDPRPRRRWLRLLGYSLRDLATTPGLGPLQDLHMILAIPLDDEGRPWRSAELANSLSELLETRLDPQRLQVVGTDSCAGYQALMLAREGLQTGRYPSCLVAGADSLIDGRVLLDLAAEGRLLTEENSDGLSPGEAAACLLLQTAQQGAIARVRGLGVGHEPGLLFNEIPLRGDGMVAAAQAALQEAGLAMHDLDFRLSDATGEGYHFREQQLLVTRLLRQRKPEFPLWLCAANLGHVGAAAGLCGLVQAIVACRRGYAPGPRALATVGSTQGERGALVLEVQT